MSKDKDYLEFYERNKIDFEKETKELEKMIKETIGENNENYYRISQMLRLIELDYCELLEVFYDLTDIHNDFEDLLKDFKIELSDIQKSRTEEDDNQDYDVVSEIVKQANKIDENNQRLALAYITGIVDCLQKMNRKNKIKSLSEKTNKLSKKPIH